MFVFGTTFSQTTYLHCGQLLDMKSNRVQNEMTVVIEMDKITDIKRGYADGADTIEVIDLKGKFVMPGWICMCI